MTTKHSVPGDPAERIRIKRIYETAGSEDGHRILIDRLWPRGMSKEHARLDGWEKGVAPSDDLRKWFQHKSERWAEFQERYRAELKEKDSELDALAAIARSGTLTLLYGAADEEHNNAVVLREVLLEREKQRDTGNE
ncbi:DUF488 domain-containing protein [Mesorhizobium koreense]|uniref:DUF488 domain-containing protein n=1 Tax=Mesorhizobium koreense TaxID=3074855 RepID=UPI00287BAE0C|nr:DUF488 domain-containing protein [Mesorhizobium sp. WR6]